MLKYLQEILNFIQELPPTLEQLYLEINGDGLNVDMEDFIASYFPDSLRLTQDARNVFNPLGNMEREIFL